jgi:hypothetical protein
MSVDFTVTAYLVSDPQITATQNFTLTSGYGTPGQRVVFTSTPIRTAEVGQPYEYTVQAQGSSTTGTVTYSLEEGPDGMTINGSTGEVNWTPTEAGTVTVTIKATVMELGAVFTGTQTFTITVTGAQNNYQVSGRTTRASDGSGVTAMIQFIPASSNNSINGANGVTVSTDQDGYYRASLPEGIYIAYAYAVNGNTFDRTLAPQYYEGASDIADATPITIDEDMSGINFSFGAVSSSNSSAINGTILSPEGTPVAGYVTAAMVEQTGNGQVKFLSGHTVQAGSNGTYSFTNLAAGEYILLALTGNSGYQQGYRTEGNSVTTNWKNAARFSVGSNATATGMNINLDEAPATNGSGSVTGTVRSGIPGTVSWLSGTFVYVIDPYTRDVIASTSSNNKGEYSLQSLPFGSYMLMADKVGYESQEFAITLSNDQSSVSHDFTLSTGSASSVTPAGTNAALALYPNPAGDFVQVSLPAEGTFTVSVVSLIGETLTTTRFEAGTSGSTHSLSTRLLPAGSYLLRIDGRNTHTALPFTIAR